MKFNLFGKGKKLQVAIMVACQMAFILFGYDQGSQDRHSQSKTAKD